MSVLVFVETNDNKISKAAQEAVSYGKKLGDVTVVTYGSCDDSTLASLGNNGAKTVLTQKSMTAFNDQQATRLVVQAAEETGANTIIFAQDQSGKAVAPRVAIRLNAGHASGAIALPEGNNVKTNVFSGKAFETVAINTDKKVISVLPNSFGVESIGGSAEVKEVAYDLGAAGITVKEKKGTGGALSLPEAELVVSAGRGLKGPENWGMVEDLAETLNAATACSRPVADIGWRPHHEHVGQTGLAIRPNLYIAAGISGAIQHIAGINSSKVKVVINTDPEAPFFKAADYGIIGDAFEVLPKLNEAIKTLKASQN